MYESSLYHTREKGEVVLWAYRYAEIVWDITEGWERAKKSSAYIFRLLKLLAPLGTLDIVLFTFGPFGRTGWCVWLTWFFLGAGKKRYRGRKRKSLRPESNRWPIGGKVIHYSRVWYQLHHKGKNYDETVEYYGYIQYFPLVLII